MKKTIGTFVPLTALRTNTAPGETGTFAAGLAFLDWLEKTGQTAWQMLPLHEMHLEPGSTTVHVPSPYKGYGVGLDPKLFSFHMSVPNPSSDDIDEFLSLHKAWLPDYCLFVVLRDRLKTDRWTSWPHDILTRSPSSITNVKRALDADIRRVLTAQWKLHQQFHELRDKAHRLGIALVGDLPFYIPLQSPLVWSKQQIFCIEDNGQLLRVSGIPDGPFSHFGRQIWGHPLYRWDRPDRAASITSLWKTRLAYAASLFDLIRLDHARGFYLYGSIDHNNADRDAFLVGPGMTLLSEIVSFTRSIGLDLFVEDSGDRTTDLRRDLTQLGIPGMKIFRYALTTRGEERYFPQYAEPHLYPKNSVAVTTTHDTETLVGYLATLTTKQKQKLSRGAKVAYTVDDRDLAVHLRHALIDSPAETVLIPIQDWLLSAERINVPGTEKEINDPNWRYVLATPVEDLPVDGLMS